MVYGWSPNRVLVIFIFIFSYFSLSVTASSSSSIIVSDGSSNLGFFLNFLLVIVIIFARRKTNIRSQLDSNGNPYIL